MPQTDYYNDTVSIQLVSPASGDYPSKHAGKWSPCRSFHSISFPSEWGQDSVATILSECLLVSIQLVSPASGDERSEYGD